MLRALPLMGRLEKQAFQQAGDLLKEAVILEPDYAVATCWAAYWQLIEVAQGWSGDVRAATTEATRLADRAIMLDSQDARCLSVAGHVRAFLHHRPREALTLHERALTLNPTLAMAWCLSGISHLYLGNAEEAGHRVRHAKRLSPHDPQTFLFETAEASALLLKGEYAEAVRIGREAGEMNPSFAAGCKPYLAALGHLGYTNEAELARHRLLSIQPHFTVAEFVASSPYERADHTNLFAEGLRLAGIPG